MAEQYPPAGSPAQPQATQVSTAPATSSGTASKPGEILGKLVSDLRSVYTRPCHGGRLDQIESVAATLAHLASQLPEEEARESDFEARLLADHEAGTLPHVLSHDARERLTAALGARKAA